MLIELHMLDRRGLPVNIDILLFGNDNQSVEINTFLFYLLLYNRKCSEHSFIYPHEQEALGTNFDLNKSLFRELHLFLSLACNTLNKFNLLRNNMIIELNMLDMGGLPVYIDILLFGNDDLSVEINTFIFSCVQKYIKDTRRFA
jgi:hypothetical protein